MKCIPILSWAAASLLMAQPVTASVLQSAAPAAAPTAASVPEADRKICRSMTPTGSIMAKRICMTKRQWVEFRDATTRAAESMRDHQHGYDPRLGN